MQFFEAVEYLAEKIVEKAPRDALMRRAAIEVIESAKFGTDKGGKCACDEAVRTLKECD